MAYTVKQVAAISGVSVRALHFYDQTGLLKPAYQGANGYRFYEEPQLLRLQQILFYRELGFELKQIKEVLGRADFETVMALESHREVLKEKLARTRTLIQTIEKTVEHLKGAKIMESRELFAGFSVAAGGDRFDVRVELGGEPLDCKVSGRDTDGAMCVFEFTSGWPRHLHHGQDEWVYVVEGEWEFELADKQFHLAAGESIFIPRKVAHVWAPSGRRPAKVINVYQPAGKMEEFFRVLGRLKDLPTREQVIDKNYTDEQKDALGRLFDDHGMDLLGPGLIVE